MTKRTETSVPKPHPSWVWDPVTKDWEAPVPLPEAYRAYVWDEETLSWLEAGG
jgi:hypothetical protein